MMMKIKHFIALAILLPLTSYFSPLAMSAQEKQLFTLEELNYGGNRNHILQPENKWFAWWGDQLVRNDVEECYLVDKKTGKEKCLFTLDEVNEWLKSDDMYHVRALYNASFPYPDQPLVALGNKKSFLLLNFKTHQTAHVRLFTVNPYTAMSSA